MTRNATVNDPAAVADALHSAAIHLLRRIRKEDERTGVTPGRLSALSVLVFGGPMRLTDLARAEQVRPPTMTRIVAGLEAAGLVHRHAVEEDARAVRIEATPRGTRVMQDGRRRRVRRLAGALRRLTPDEIALLARAAPLMERVATTLYVAGGRLRRGRLVALSSPHVPRAEARRPGRATALPCGRLRVAPGCT
jgi:DNA-binding MarR family transcriptional regulator